MVAGERTCSYSPGDPGSSGSYSVPYASHDHGGDVVAWSVREGRPRGIVLCDSSRGKLGCEGTGGMVATPEPSDVERDCDTRSLAGTLHSPRLSERIWKINDEEGLLELRVRRGLGALLRRDDA